MGDNDMGEMFLNFILHESVQALCGVDLTCYFPDGVPFCLVGTVDLMCNGSEIVAISSLSRDDVVVGIDIWGSEWCDKGILVWPSGIKSAQESCQPSVSALVYKSREDGVIVDDVHCYVDDVRVTGPSEQECWQASQWVSFVLALLGIQDAMRKRLLGDLEAGAWRGNAVHSTSGDVVNVLTTQEKWDTLKACVDWIWVHHEDADGMDHALLESKRGFLVHMGQMYPDLNPYFKGIHATLESWQKGRDKSGWLLKRPSLNSSSDALDAGKKRKAGSSTKAKARARKPQGREAMGAPSCLPLYAQIGNWRTRCPGKRSSGILILPGLGSMILQRHPQKSPRLNYWRRTYELFTILLLKIILLGDRQGWVDQLGLSMDSGTQVKSKALVLFGEWCVESVHPGQGV
jgi:hypothetical protein